MRVWKIGGRAALVGILVASPAAGQAPGLTPRPPAGQAATQPSYLPYVDFTADESPTALRLKQAYNDAARRYNEALYEYHVVLAQHDALVDRHNASEDANERRQARDAATALRGKLASLRRDVTQRAGQVDAAARQAAGAGVVISR